jgi:hypothetical protein
VAGNVPADTIDGNLRLEDKKSYDLGVYFVLFCGCRVERQRFIWQNPRGRGQTS